MHIIEPNEYTVHSIFSKEFRPILTIDSGETVRYRNVPDAHGQLVDWSDNKLVRLPLFDSSPREGHALLGPIAIRGAKKGMVLEIQVGEIRVGRIGWNTGGGTDWGLYERLGVADAPGYKPLWVLDAERGIGLSESGHTVYLHPFMGVMGMPPDEDGRHSTTPPRTCGGNIDCKLLVTGSSLFLPIPVDGALFSVGDGHALQGDGEVSGTAIECPMENLDLTFILHPKMTLNTPRARTPEGWITLGFHEDLNEASIIALNAMLDLMEEQHRISRKVALSLASTVVDLRITQIVNEVQGVHALLPNGAIA